MGRQISPTPPSCLPLTVEEHNESDLSDLELEEDDVEEEKTYHQLEGLEAACLHYRRCTPLSDGVDESWLGKHPESWCQEEVQDWIITCCSPHHPGTSLTPGASHHSGVSLLQGTSAGGGFRGLTGAHLCRMDLQQFVARDPRHGAHLFNCLKDRLKHTTSSLNEFVDISLYNPAMFDDLELMTTVSDSGPSDMDLESSLTTSDLLSDLPPYDSLEYLDVDDVHLGSWPFPQGCSTPTTNHGSGSSLDSALQQRRHRASCGEESGYSSEGSCAEASSLVLPGGCPPSLPSPHHHHPQQAPSLPPVSSFFTTSAPPPHTTIPRSPTSTLNRTDMYPPMLDDSRVSCPTMKAMGEVTQPRRKPGRPRKTPAPSVVNGIGGEVLEVEKKGRKPGQNAKGNHLWEFVRDLLHNPKYNPSLIKWENREDGIFKFVKSDAVARLWGAKKNNKSMTYEKLSRAMRFCRKSKFFRDIPKDGKYPKKLCFRFGEKAFGWEDY